MILYGLCLVKSERETERQTRAGKGWQRKGVREVEVRSDCRRVRVGCEWVCDCRDSDTERGLGTAWQGSGLGDWAWGGWVSELPKSVKREVEGLGCFGLQGLGCFGLQGLGV